MEFLRERAFLSPLLVALGALRSRENRFVHVRAPRMAGRPIKRTRQMGLGGAGTFFSRASRFDGSISYGVHSRARKRPYGWKGDSLTEKMEVGALNDKANTNRDLEGYLLSILVLLSFGFLVLVPSMLSYWYLTDMQKTLTEQAERQGVGEIPGVNLDSDVRWALTLIVVGGIMIVAAIVLAFVALLRNRG